jgi:exoribonuclease-2
MNVFYEEEGTFKVGAVLADNDTSLQVEAPHGKRSKVKSSNVLFRFEGPISSFMEDAQKAADALDVNFLWECCGQDEFGFDALAKDYYGHVPNAQESAALLFRLHGAPMYFYRKGKGRYKPAPVDALKAALASVERKREQAMLQARYVEQLARFQLPEEFKARLPELLYKPDRNTIEVKAMEQAAAEVKTQHCPPAGEVRSHPPPRGTTMSIAFCWTTFRAVPVSAILAMQRLQQISLWHRSKHSASTT